MYNSYYIAIPQSPTLNPSWNPSDFLFYHRPEENFLLGKSYMISSGSLGKSVLLGTLITSITSLLMHHITWSQKWHLTIITGSAQIQGKEPGSLGSLLEFCCLGEGKRWSQGGYYAAGLEGTQSGWRSQRTLGKISSRWNSLLKCICIYWEKIFFPTWERVCGSMTDKTKKN